MSFQNFNHKASESIEIFDHMASNNAAMPPIAANAPTSVFFPAPAVTTGGRLVVTVAGAVGAVEACRGLVDPLGYLVAAGGGIVLTLAIAPHSSRDCPFLQQVTLPVFIVAQYSPLWQTPSNID